MIKLPEVHTMKKDINELAKQIQLCLLTIEKNDHLHRKYKITHNFSIELKKGITDIYVIDSTLFIPYMSVKKLNNLPKFLSDIGYSQVFHHEACHLLDLNFMREHNLSYTKEELEERAEHAEHKVLY